MPPMDLGQLHSQGVRPEDATYVIVKAAVSHRDAYDPIVRASFYVDSAGLCTSNLKRLPYRKMSGNDFTRCPDERPSCRAIPASDAPGGTSAAARRNPCGQTLPAALRSASSLAL